MGTPPLSRCSQSYSRANEDDSGLAWTESKRGSELSKVSPEFPHIFLSPVFAPDRRPIIEAGIKAYLAGDHTLAVHLLVPQIEQALRVLLELAGGSVLKPARLGMLTYKLLHDMLQDPLLVQVLGEDTLLYLCVLLTDQRGWNIRNRISHGLCDVHEFSPAMSDRVMHVLLCLALVRVRERQPTDT